MIITDPFSKLPWSVPNSWIFPLLMLMPFLSASQTRPEILLENLDETTLEVKCLCVPGVRNRSRSKGIELSYNLIGPGDLKATRSEYGEPYPRYDKFRKFRVKAGFPVIRTEAFKMIVGYQFWAEQFEFTDLSNDHQGILQQLDNVNLKSSAFDLTFSFSLNESNYIGAKLRSQFSGGYDAFISMQNRYHIFNGAVVYGIKEDPDNEVGLGLAFSSSFRNDRPTLLPFVFWNKNFTPSLGLEATFPTKVFLRYNLSESSILMGGFKYNGESYSFDQELIERQVSFNHSELQFVLDFQQQVAPWIWLNMVGGYQHNFTSNFSIQESMRDVLSVDIQNSWYLNFGVFISPPDDFMTNR